MFSLVQFDANSILSIDKDVNPLNYALITNLPVTAITYRPATNMRIYFVRFFTD